MSNRKHGPSMTRHEAERCIADGWDWGFRDKRCCPDAAVVSCVCRVSVNCPTHGLICVGSHD